VLGLAFDGTGFGADQESSWGGEFLLCFPYGFERLATFRPIRLPGGNVAMREVWRIAYALLYDAFEGEPPLGSLPLFDLVPAPSRSLVHQMLERDLNSPRAHGVGRYFDAFGAIGLGRPTSNYEGQVAIAWNTAARGAIGKCYPYAIDQSGSLLEIDLRQAVRAMVGDLASGAGAQETSARFHGTVIAAAVEVSRALLDTNGALPVALSGGVFQNPLLSAGIAHELMNNTKVLRHSAVPPGDGGIALGQVLIADAVSRDKE
jgi:hydrogenase maturation protein HypF